LATGTREHDRGVERQERDHEIRTGARVREVAAEGGLVPGEEVGEIARGSTERGQASPDEWRRPQLAHRRPAADARGVVVRVDAPELAELADVYQHRRLAAPLPEVDDQVGAAREGLGGGILCEDRGRLDKRRGVPILEPRQEHRYGAKITIGASIG